MYRQVSYTRPARLAILGGGLLLVIIREDEVLQPRTLRNGARNYELSNSLYADFADEGQTLENQFMQAIFQ